MEITEYQTKDNFAIRLEARFKNAELVRARESLDLNIQEAAEAMDLSPNTLCGFENLKSYPSQKSQEKICEFYRKNGYFVLEDDVFPQELKKVKASKLIAEKEIPKENLVSLNYVDRKMLPSYTIDDEIDRRLLADDVSKAMKDLTEREICVLEHRFGLNGKEVLSLKKVGEKFNVEAETIRQVEARVLRKLRHPSRAGKLREYL